MLMQKRPFSSIAAAAGLRRLMQASTSGGSAETEATALTVTPKRPARPSVVTIDTAVAAPAMALTNAAGLSIGAASLLGFGDGMVMGCVPD
jgi:hypothetical protein